jgi:hypothetical protein
LSDTFGAKLIEKKIEQKQMAGISRYIKKKAITMNQTTINNIREQDFAFDVLGNLIDPDCPPCPVHGGYLCSCENCERCGELVNCGTEDHPSDESIFNGVCDDCQDEDDEGSSDD